jgi:hypothetical protein
MTDEAKTPGTDAAADGESPPIIDFFADMPGVGEHVKDAYQNEQNRVGSDAEDKTPANEGFSEKIYRDITGRDISEHGQFEMPPVGGDPWDAGNTGGQAVPEPPYMYSEQFYKDIDLKGMNYEDMATQNWKVREEIHDNSLEQDHKRLSEAAGDDVDQKDGPGFDINASNFQNVWTESARPMQFGPTDPNAVAYYKSAEATDRKSVV